MTLLNFTKRGDTASMVGPEEIVREAERIGRIDIERDYRNEIYKAEIIFSNRNGSNIRAAGIDEDFFTALAKAIQEAQRLS